MRPIVLACLLAASVSAQTLSGTFTPATGTPGQQMTLRLANGGPAPVTLSNGCGYNSIVQGSPTGPVVFAPAICPLILITISPCGTRNVNFNVPASLVPGVYYVRVSWSTATGTTLTTESFPFSVVGPGDALLTASTTPRIGTSLVLDINAPAFGNGLYFTAASFSTNTGFPLLSAYYVSLDIDFLFNLSFPIPDPVLFTSFQGSLTPGGTAAGIAVNIPNLPALLWKGLAVQAALVDAVGSVGLTNPLVFSFIP